MCLRSNILRDLADFKTGFRDRGSAKSERGVGARARDFDANGRRQPGAASQFLRNIIDWCGLSLLD